MQMNMVCKVYVKERVRRYAVEKCMIIDYDNLMITLYEIWIIGQRLAELKIIKKNDLIIVCKINWKHFVQTKLVFGKLNLHTLALLFVDRVILTITF